MSRPKIYQDGRVWTSIRLPRELSDRLRAVADERAVSVNLLMTKAIADYLSRLPDVPS